MTSRIRPLQSLGVLLLALCAGAMAAPASAPPAPSNPLDAVFRPEFTTVQGPLAAGKAFFVRLERCPSPVMLTALHLFGPSGGLRDQMGPEELRRGVSHVKLAGMEAGAKSLSFDLRSLTPAGVEPCCTGRAMRGLGDVAAFTAPADPAPAALQVATAAATQGQHVFVLASLVRGASAGLRHEAVVMGAQDGYVYYKYVDPTVELRATSGAPVIDAAGKVVAINLGGGQMPEGGAKAMVGMGNPATTWRGAVEASCLAQ